MSNNENKTARTLAQRAQEVAEAYEHDVLVGGEDLSLADLIEDAMQGLLGEILRAQGPATFDGVEKSPAVALFLGALPPPIAREAVVSIGRSVVHAHLWALDDVIGHEDSVRVTDRSADAIMEGLPPEERAKAEAMIAEGREKAEKARSLLLFDEESVDPKLH